MSACLICGAWAPDDPDTGYRADTVCPDCQRELDGPPLASAQGDGDPGQRVICAWCGVVLQDGPGLASHGICAPCYQTQIVSLAAEGTGNP